MASNYEPFFERSRFGQQKKRPQTDPLSENPPAIKDSWREDFRFSDDLAELERRQPVRQQDQEYQQHLQQPPTYPTIDPRVDSRPTHKTYARSPQVEKPPFETPALVMQYNKLLEAYQAQAQRMLALEEYIASLQNDNTELLHDNKLMAQQIQRLKDEPSDDQEEAEPVKTESKRARFQKIWGKLHLLL